MINLLLLTHVILRTNVLISTCTGKQSLDLVDNVPPSLLQLLHLNQLPCLPRQQRLALSPRCQKILPNLSNLVLVADHPLLLLVSFLTSNLSMTETRTPTTLTTTQSLLDSLEDLVVSSPLLLTINALCSILSAMTTVVVTLTRHLMMVTTQWTMILVVNAVRANGPWLHLLPHNYLHLLHLPLVTGLWHKLCQTSSHFWCTNTATS